MNPPNERTLERSAGNTEGHELLGSGTLVQRSWLADLLALVLFEVAFYLAYRYAMTFSHASASPFWFPDSVLLCALLVVRRSRWWLFVLAPLPIRLLVETPADVPLWFLLATFAIDSAKGLLTATLLQKVVVNPLRFATIREFAD